MLRRLGGERDKHDSKMQRTEESMLRTLCAMKAIRAGTRAWRWRGLAAGLRAFHLSTQAPAEVWNEMGCSTSSLVPQFSTISLLNQIASVLDRLSRFSCSRDVDRNLRPDNLTITFRAWANVGEPEP